MLDLMADPAESAGVILRYVVARKNFHELSIISTAMGMN